MKTWLASLLMVFLSVRIAGAEDAELKLAAPAALEASGLLSYLVPRFSLKTGVRMTRVDEGDAAQMRIGADGTPVFEGLGRTWHLSHDGDARAERFLDWLTSDVGLATIEAFAATGAAAFAAPKTEVAAETGTVFEGDALRGEAISLSKCGRCHVVSAANRMKGMGSTPSFALMRTFADWELRFASFHMLRPHPAFTRVEGISEDFDPSRPPPIVPLTLTLEDLDAILAYVSGIPPANLGAPLQFQ